ncbi:MAG: M48 family metalloprotease [Pseudomonadota bacterium]
MRTALVSWASGTACAAVLFLSACASKPRQPPPNLYPTPAPYATQPGASPQYPSPQQYPYPQQPGTAPPQQPAPVPGPPPAPTSLPPVSAPVAYDPINAVDINFLRGRAQAVLGELVANLPPAQQQRVQGIPLIPDTEVGEVNAFAACTEKGKAVMAISDGMLDISAHLAQARAIDEIFGSRKVDEYIAFVARNQRPDSPVVRPPPGFFDPTQSVDPRKVQRQHQLLDEQIAFVLGHELAHHYLGHLPCTAGSVTLSEMNRVLADAVPVFNQPNEAAADAAGVNNVLTTGSRRQGYRFTEGGALLTMQFFGGIDQLSPLDVLFGFERSHPPPAGRVVIIQQTANAFRMTGGQGLPILGL